MNLLSVLKAKVRMVTAALAFRDRPHKGVCRYYFNKINAYRDCAPAK